MIALTVIRFLCQIVSLPVGKLDSQLLSSVLLLDAMQTSLTLEKHVLHLSISAFQSEAYFHLKHPLMLSKHRLVSIQA